MNQEVPEGGKYSLACLPAVTIIDSNFSKLVEIATNPQVYEIKPSIIDELKQYGRDQFITSKQVLGLLEDKFKTEDVLKADGIETYRRTSVSIEIWAANNILKSKIFDLISLYLIGERRTSLRENMGLMIEDESITGEKSGIYNFDFGEILYGAMLRFTVGYNVGFYIVKDFIPAENYEVSVINNSLI
jgi:hypothetical protein